MRALRFIIEKRTAADAEEEIRLVFGQVAEIMMKDCPYVFGDFTKVMKKGLCEYVPRYSKI
jgi:thymidylate synthase ThyX